MAESFSTGKISGWTEIEFSFKMYISNFEVIFLKKLGLSTIYLRVKEKHSSIRKLITIIWIF